MHQYRFFNIDYLYFFGGTHWYRVPIICIPFGTAGQQQFISDLPNSKALLWRAAGKQKDRFLINQRGGGVGQDVALASQPIWGEACDTPSASQPMIKLWAGNDLRLASWLIRKPFPW